jgi:TetR/AcrR family transcriptional repressor of nem operon
MDHKTKGERTRSRIVAQAAALFNQHGYEGTSMQGLMAATGLQKGGLYRYFSSKEALAAEAFRHAWSAAMAARIGDIDAVSGAVAKLRYMVERFVNMRSPVPGGCPLMNTAVEADDGNPLLRGLAAGALKEWQGLIVEIAKEGIATGEVRPETDPRRLANRIIGVLEGALLISRLERSRHALEDAKLALDAELGRIDASPRVADAS